jgi:hypothetical protein
MELNKELLHELFEYRDGNLFRKISRRSFKAGEKVGNLWGNGYLRVGINKKNYLLHRIIFMMFYGYLPEEIDHIDGNPLNNNINNLRAANPVLNGYNQKKRITNKVGIKGIRFHKNSYEARCSVNKKRFQVGRFDTLEEAKIAIMEFRSKHHGNFANHG